MLKERGPDVRVADAMSTTLPTVSQRRYLDDALRILQEKSAPAVAVVDTMGRLVGLVTSETVGEMMMLHNALPKGVKWGPWSRPVSVALFPSMQGLRLPSPREAVGRGRGWGVSAHIGETPHPGSLRSPTLPTASRGRVNARHRCV